MLQTRPSSASGMLQPSQNQPHQYPSNSSHAQRNSIHGMGGAAGGSGSGYRGTAGPPTAPYAFTSTPQPQFMRTDQRSTSAPATPVLAMSSDHRNNGSRSRYPVAASVSTVSSASTNVSSVSQKSGSKDDSTIVGNRRMVNGAARPQSTVITSFSGDSLAPAGTSSSKAQPDRYRRPNNRRADSSNSSNSIPSTTQAPVPAVLGQKSSNTMHSQGKGIPQGKTQDFSLQIPLFSALSMDPSAAPRVTNDEMHLSKSKESDHARRYRRRSIHTIEADGYVPPPSLVSQGSRQSSSANGRIDHHQNPLGSSPVITFPSNGRNASSESVNSTRSGSHSRPSSVSNS